MIMDRTMDKTLDKNLDMALSKIMLEKDRVKNVSQV